MNEPIKDAVRVVLWKLETDTDLVDSMTLKPVKIAGLLDFVKIYVVPVQRFDLRTVRHTVQPYPRFFLIYS